jgi:4-amino-4-deoxy-L-arabinose transferase-like glycosyltransferase
MRRLAVAAVVVLLLAATCCIAHASDTASAMAAVGGSGQHEAAVLNATAARARHEPPVPWHQRALPVPTLGLLVAAAVAWFARGAEVRRAFRGERPVSRVAVAPPAPQVRPGAAQPRAAATLAGIGVLAVGAYLAWAGMQRLEAGHPLDGLWRFAGGCVAAGIALYALNRRAGGTHTWSCFVPAGWQPLQARDGRGRLALLLSGAGGSLATCLYVLLYQPQEQATAVALWLAAQLWIIAAAFPPVAAHPDERAAARRAWPLVGLLLLGAILTRFWQIGYYPDFVHHDHCVYGHEVLQMARGQWRPFFVRVAEGAAGRPWLLYCLGALTLFGHHLWVLRSDGAITGILIVWGTYLLGSVLCTRRIGLIAALLVLVNNDLLLYSRQPSHIDPVAPFVLALYALVVGLQRGCRFHWCLAGLLSGWALIMYRASTIFPIIEGAGALYLCLRYPRQLWAQRAGLMWFAAAACIVYLPMVPDMLQTQELTNRLRDQGMLFGPHGAPRWDGALWASQLLRSFGALIYYRDSGAWWVTTGQSICMPAGSCLLGIGLVYLLGSWRSPATFVLLAWTCLCIFMGSAMIVSPPTLYHILAAIVAVMLISAVGVDRALALAARQPRGRRLSAYAVVGVLLAVASVEQLHGFWTAVRRPAPTADGHVVLQENARITAARYIREHPEYRYYLVRSAAEPDTACTDVLYRFFTDDSDVSDLTAAVAPALPVPPVEPAAGVAFIVFPRRAAERDAIAAMYPSAHAEELFYTDGPAPLWVYRVDAQAIRDVYNSRHAS